TRRGERFRPRRTTLLLAAALQEAGVKTSGKGRLAVHQVAVHPTGRFAPLLDRPDDEGLAAHHVAGGEDAWGARHLLAVRHDVPAVVELQPQVAEEPRLLGADEPESQKDEL